MAENSETVRGGRRRRIGRRFVVPRPGATLSHLVKTTKAVKTGYFGNEFQSSSNICVRVFADLRKQDILVMRFKVLAISTSEILKIFNMSPLPFLYLQAFQIYIASQTTVKSLWTPYPVFPCRPFRCN
jgi:hypothetical protein